MNGKNVILYFYSTNCTQANLFGAPVSINLNNPYNLKCWLAQLTHFKKIGRSTMRFTLTVFLCLKTCWSCNLKSRKLTTIFQSHA